MYIQKHPTLDLWVGDDGRVFSEKFVSSDHYPRINFLSQRIQISRLVAETYLEKPENIQDFEVCHLDDNPQNNHWKNLKWATHLENMRDCFEKDVPKKPIISHKMARFYEDICRLRSEGKTSRDIGKILKVHESRISQALGHMRRLRMKIPKCTSYKKIDQVKLNS